MLVLVVHSCRQNGTYVGRHLNIHKTFHQQLESYDQILSLTLKQLLGKTLLGEQVSFKDYGFNMKVIILAVVEYFL